MMRPWTYLLPAALWLWVVRRHCERLTLPDGSEAYDAGGTLILVAKPR